MSAQTTPSKLLSLSEAEDKLANPATDLEKALVAHINGIKYTAKAQLFRYLYNAVTTQDAPLIDDISAMPQDFPYEYNHQMANLSIYSPSKSILLTTLRFACDHIGTEPAIVIYIGAPNIENAMILAAMTPNIKWVVIQPDINYVELQEIPVVVRIMHDRNGVPTKMTEASIAPLLQQVTMDSSTNVFVFNDYMTNEYASAVATVFGTGKVYAVSRFRSNVFDDPATNKGAPPFPDTTDLMWGYALVYNWMRIMQPKMFQTRFRQPFYEESPDKLAEYAKRPDVAKDFALANTAINGMPPLDFLQMAEQKTLRFYAGKMRPIIFWSFGSTETVLESDGKELADQVNYKTSEGIMLAYNGIYRSYLHVKNPNADTSIGFDNCNDCACENAVLEKWLSLYKTSIFVPASIPRNVKDLVVKITGLPGRDSMLQLLHGYFSQPRDGKDLTEIFKVAGLIEAERREKTSLLRKYRHRGYITVSKGAEGAHEALDSDD